MKKRTLKRFLLTSGSLAMIVVGIVLACAGGDDFEDYHASFFSPEVSHDTNFKPFFRSENPFYGMMGFYEKTPTIFDSVNLSGWQSFFGRSVSLADLEFLVYHSRISEIDSLIFFLKNSLYPVKPYLKDLSIFSFPHKDALREALFYLGFAKRCEPYANYVPEYWSSDRSDDPRRDTQAMEKLIEGGKRAFSYVKNPFIRQRYLFQIIRLLYQAGKYSEAISFYDGHVLSETPDESIQYRTLGYLAGACYKTENYSRANYLYAVIYDGCPEMRIVAWQSFHPQDDEDWNGSLAMAKTDREKEVLWQLLGIYADPLRAMKHIYELDPQSDLLDVLLTRAINIEEEDFIPDLYGWQDQHDSTYSLKAAGVNPDLVSFVDEVAGQQKARKLYLWQLAAGYLHVVGKDYRRADEYLRKAELKSGKDQLVNEQVRLIRMISKVELLTRPDRKSEDELARELLWISNGKHDPALRNWPMYAWALKRLASKYAAFGDSIKAQCLDYTRDKSFYDDTMKVKTMVAYMDKPAKTAFDRFILGVHPYSRNDLFEYEAVKLVYEDQLKRALAKFEAAKGSGSSSLPADPFLIHMIDCHDCDQAADQETGYTKYSLVRRMLDLENKVLADSRNTSQELFLLGNAFYNITWFGNNRAFYATKIKPVPVVWEFGPDFADFSDPIFNCAFAEEFYRKAMIFSADMEFKTQCCFMAAKCEQNRFAISDGYSYRTPFKPGEYYKLLRFKFPKTKYYQEIIKECGYFRTYAGVKN